MVFSGGVDTGSWRVNVKGRGGRMFGISRVRNTKPNERGYHMHAPVEAIAVYKPRAD